MPLNLRWVGEEARERVLKTRLLCYGSTNKDMELYRNRILWDQRAQNGDYLLAERDGMDVGTLTSLRLNLWLRGARLDCQGIAWVGTIKTHRRGGSGGEKGIASQVMHEALRLGRERGQAISALMPFRATFYEHFGYGFAEKRAEWTLPMGVIPSGAFDSIRFMEETDKPAMAELHNRIASRGNCDIERNSGGWHYYFKDWEHAMFVVDRPDNNGPVHGWMALVAEMKDNRSILRIPQHEYDSIDALKRQLHFLSSLKDQHGSVLMHLPGDLNLNLILRETQLPHRLVEHPAAICKPYTRMQIRVLDHQKVIESIAWDKSVQGKLGIAIRECEGNISRFTIDVSDGRASVKSPSTDDVELSDVHWAEIISGFAKPCELASLGLIKASTSALKILDTLGNVPAPYSAEYF